MAPLTDPNSLARAYVDTGPLAALALDRGGRELHPGCGELAWRVYQDPSGNEFCVLPARSSGQAADR